MDLAFQSSYSEILLRIHRLELLSADSTQNERSGTNHEAAEITCAWAMLELPNSARDMDNLLMRTGTELPLFVGDIECPVEVDYLPAPPGINLA